MPSLKMLLLVLQAATLPALKQEAVRDVASRAQFTQQMVDQIFSFEGGKRIYLCHGVAFPFVPFWGNPSNFDKSASRNRTNGSAARIFARGLLCCRSSRRNGRSR